MNWHGLRAAFALRYNVMSLHVLPKQPTAQRAADFLRLSCSPRLGVRQPGYSFHATAHALYMMVLPALSRAPPPAKCSPHHGRNGLPYSGAVNRRSCRLSGDCIGSLSTRSSPRCVTVEWSPVNASVRPSQACLRKIFFGAQQAHCRLAAGRLVWAASARRSCRFIVLGHLSFWSSPAPEA
jgi:hypothetical protein